MLVDYRLGQSSVIVRVKVRNSAGAGLTGLTGGSPGLVISTIADNEAAAVAYRQTAGAIDAVITPGTFSAPAAGRCRFGEVDSANHRGIYEVQIDDTRFAVAGAKSLLVSLSGAAGMAECDAVIPLRAVDPYDSQRMGLAALPAAGVVQPQTGDAYAAATAVTALVAGVKARTDNLPADPAGMSGLAAAHGVGSWVGGGGGGGAGTGSTPVDHNYGGTDNLAYLVPGGVRVADARIDVYLTSDWSANRRGPFYVVASSLTGADGRWVRPVMLDPGAYTVVFYKLGEYGPDTASVVVP